MSTIERSLTALILATVLGAGVALVSMSFADDDVLLDESAFRIPDDETAANTAVVRREPAPEVTRPAAVPRPAEPAAAPVTVVAATATSIVGTVTGPDELPIEGVEITSALHFPDAEMNYGTESTHEARALSDEAGRFHLEVPGHGAYRILARRSGFQPEVVPKARAGTDLEIRLKPGASILGKVHVKDGSRPIAGAKITARKLDSPWTAEAESDEEGVFRIEGVYVDDVYVSILHDVYVPLKDVLVKVLAAGEHVADFAMDPGKAIAGTVVDPRGQPVTDAEVVVGEKRARTDVIGAFRLSGLAPQGHHFVVEAPGYLTYGQNVNLSGSREEATVAVTLAEGGTVRGMVIDESGKPIAGCEVKVFQSWGRGDWMSETGGTRFSGTTDEEGRFSLTGLHANGWGQYVIRARAEGYADAYSDDLKLTDVTKPVDVQIVVGAGGSIRGRVLDESNQPVAGAKLTLNPHNVYEWSNRNASLQVAISGEDGSYAFTGLGPRKYRVSALAPGYASQYRSDLEIRGSAELAGTDFTMESGDRVEGTVKNEDGEPLAGANVWMYSQRSYARAVTDEEGRYAIDNLSRGPFSANASADGYSYEQKRDVFPEGGKIDFELKRNGYVWGDVVDKTTGEPVRRFSATLHERQQNGRDGWRHVNGQWLDDPTGTFKIYQKDGVYKLTINAQGYLPFEDENVAINVSGKPEPRKIELVPGGALEGWVTDHRGMPVANAQIYVSRHGEQGEKRFEQRSQSEMDGYFYVDALEAGTYDVAIFGWGSCPLQIRAYVTIVGGDLGVLRFEAARLSPLTVMAKDEEDKPIDRVSVRVETLGRDPIGMDYVEWRPNGVSVFRPSFVNSSWLRRGQPRVFRDLPAGRYLLTLTHDRYEPFQKEIVLEAGRELVEDVVMTARGKKPEGEGTPASSR